MTQIRILDAPSDRIKTSADTPFLKVKDPELIA